MNSSIKKLGLIGKNIAHSRSPQIYQELLQREIEYHLLDYAQLDHDLDLKELFLDQQFDGLSITSPYKRHFNQQIIYEEAWVRKIGAVNALKWDKGEIVATNTDYLAMKDLLNEYRQKWGKLTLFILGSGVMAQIVLSLAYEYALPFEHYSRSKQGDLSQFDFSVPDQSKGLIINTCSRSFVYTKRPPAEMLWWDLNYHHPHEAISDQNGMRLLYLQAKYALEFWEKRSPPA